MDLEVAMSQLMVKINSKHQIVVPSAIREELQLKAGDHLLALVCDGVIVLVPKPVDPIGELRGLGREIWEGIDAQDYVDSERDEW